jgi:hypothetical protein
MSIWSEQQSVKAPEERKSASSGLKSVEFAERIVIAAGRKIEAEWDLDSLKALARLRSTVDDAMHQAVTRMRAEGGYSWADVGTALGITRQAAEQRFGRH